MIGPRTRFDELMYCVGESATLLKELANREAEASHQLPAPDPTYGPWCADYGRQTGALEQQYRASLASIGMRIDEHGRYWVTRPATCGHRRNERNTSRDQLSCDGCRVEVDAVRQRVSKLSEEVPTNQNGRV